MQRHLSRALFLGLIAGALILGPGTRAARAEDEAPEEAEPQGIEWVSGWEAGVEQARKDGKLIFMYFGRHTPR